MEQVLKLDKGCEEAVMDLFNCRVLQLMVNILSSKVAKALPVELDCCLCKYAELPLNFPVLERNIYELSSYLKVNL